MNSSLQNIMVKCKASFSFGGTYWKTFCSNRKTNLLFSSIKCFIIIRMVDVYFDRACAWHNVCTGAFTIRAYAFDGCWVRLWLCQRRFIWTPMRYASIAWARDEMNSFLEQKVWKNKVWNKTTTTTIAVTTTVETTALAQQP